MQIDHGTIPQENAAVVKYDERIRDFLPVRSGDENVTIDLLF